MTDKCDQSLWEDLSVKELVSEDRDCRLVIKRLEEASVSYFTLEAEFMEQYQIDDFVTEWKLQSGLTIESSNNKQTIKMPRCIRGTHSFVVELGGDRIRGVIFAEIYQSQVKALQNEYSIKIHTDGLKLYIFTRETQLNIICRNRLIDMNRGLSCFSSFDENVSKMLIASSQLRSKLTDMGIYVKLRTWGQKKVCLFYSATMRTQQMLKYIEDFANLDVVIISLSHSSLTSPEVTTVKAIINEALRQSIVSIESQYEISVQFSQDNSYIVLHCQHHLFGEEPLLLLRSMLNDLLIFSVTSAQIKQFDNSLRKYLKKNSFAVEMMNRSRNETFIAVKVNEAFHKTKEQLNEFSQLFLIMLDQEIEVNIYLNHLPVHRYSQYSKRIVQIASENNFVLQNQSFLNKNGCKATFKLKDNSKTLLMKKETELQSFFVKLLIMYQILGRSHHNEEYLIKDDELVSMIIHKPDDKLVRQRQKKKEEKQQFEIPWIKCYLKSPNFNTFGEESRDYLKCSRNREIENILNSKSGLKFKVQNLQLNSSLSFVSSMNMQPYLIAKIFSTNKKLSKNFQYITLKEIKLHEQCAIAILSIDETTRCLPLYSVLRIK